MSYTGYRSRKKEVRAMEGRDYKKELKDRGFKKVVIAQKMGIARMTLDNKLNEKVPFTKCEKFMLDAILRGEKVD